MFDPQDPHAGQPALTDGPAPKDAAGAIVLVHGRGASPEDIYTVFEALEVPGLAVVAPRAADATWYPYSFLSPTARNEPKLGSALRTLGRTVADLEAQGLPAARIALLGFSQGACLSLEFVARHPRRFGAVVALSGGLIGPPGTPRDYPGSLEGTPVFLGCSDVDAHIPVERVRESAEVLARLGAAVDARIYPGMGHTVNGDELKAARALVLALAAR
jgi:predicted esterase